MKQQKNYKRLLQKLFLLEEEKFWGIGVKFFFTKFKYLSISCIYPRKINTTLQMSNSTEINLIGPDGKPVNPIMMPIQIQQINIRKII